MDVRYVTVEASKLNTLDVIDGQIIAITDKDCWFYDMAGQRRGVSGQQLVATLPTDTDRIYKDSVFFVTEGERGIYWWTGSEFKLAATISTDESVKSQPSDSKFYLVGDEEGAEHVGTLSKSSDVYVEAGTGKIRANGFTGGPATSALSADVAKSAGKATNDELGQPIASTYVKSIRTSGTSMTVTFGDDVSIELTTQDTHSVTGLAVADTESAVHDSSAGNGDVHINIMDDQTIRSSHRIVGSGITTVTSDDSGNIEISTLDKWTPNTSTDAGYVSAGVPNKIWATDEEGNPEWRNPEAQYVHPDSGVTPGTYKSVTVNAQGHVTEGTNPTTLQGFGITDGLGNYVISDAQDLDYLTTPGFYSAASGNNVTHKPEEVDSFGLIVIHDGQTGSITQKLFSSGKQYTRSSTSGTYTNWAEDMLTDTVYVHPTDPGYLHIPAGGSAGQVLSWLSSGEAQWTDPELVSVPMMEGSTEAEDGKAGIVPGPEAGPATAYLRNDGTWSVPPDTQYVEMEGTDGTSAGRSGLVPAPTAAQANMFLASSGQWMPAPTSDVKPVWQDFPE